MSRQELWHKRMGHPNFRSLEAMAKNCIVLGLPSTLPYINHVCEHCALAKSHRLSYARSVVRSKAPLQLLH